MLSSTWVAIMFVVYLTDPTTEVFIIDEVITLRMIFWIRYNI